MTCEMCGCRGSSWSSADDDDVGIDGRRLKTIASVRFRVRAGPVRGDRHGVLLKCVPKSPGDLVKNFTKSSRRVYDFAWAVRSVGCKPRHEAPDLNPARKLSSSFLELRRHSDVVTRLDVVVQRHLPAKRDPGRVHRSRPIFLLDAPLVCGASGDYM